jgi:hypothetical protein
MEVEITYHSQSTIGWVDCDLIFEVSLPYWVSANVKDAIVNGICDDLTEGTCEGDGVGGTSSGTYHWKVHVQNKKHGGSDHPRP